MGLQSSSALSLVGVSGINVNHCSLIAISIRFSRKSYGCSCEAAMIDIHAG